MRFCLASTKYAVILYNYSIYLSCLYVNNYIFDLTEIRLEELITSGYVKEDMYDDKPLSGLEFFDYVRAHHDDGEEKVNNFERSMWERLALVVHAAQVNGPSLCEMRSGVLRTDSPPSCLQKSIRFQHFGCDFHVDGPLTGADSRIFECNKGPDMSVHSLRDGTMKRDVAADMMDFIGFKGEFDGSQEHARRHKLTLIYDSEVFQPDASLQYLRDLQKHSTLFQFKNEDVSSEVPLSDISQNDEL